MRKLCLVNQKTCTDLVQALISLWETNFGECESNPVPMRSDQIMLLE